MDFFKVARTFADNVFTRRIKEMPEAEDKSISVEQKASGIEERILLAELSGDYAKAHFLKEQLTIQEQNLASIDPRAAERVGVFKEYNR